MASNPHRQGGLATPPPQLDDEDEDLEPELGDPNKGSRSAEDDEDDQGDGPDAGDDPADERPRSRASLQPAQDGAGWVLGLLLWGWVVLPFIKGGPEQVKAVWMAKFLNKAPDGSPLP